MFCKDHFWCICMWLLRETSQYLSEIRSRSKRISASTFFYLDLPKRRTVHAKATNLKARSVPVQVSTLLRVMRHFPSSTQSCSLFAASSASVEVHLNWDNNITTGCLLRCSVMTLIVSLTQDLILIYILLKTGFHLAARLVMHIMKFPLKRLMKKTHCMQLAAPLFTSCNVLIYYHITLAVLFIYLIMHTPHTLNYKINSEQEDGMQWTNPTII